MNKRPRLTPDEWETIEQALRDGIGWQNGLSDAYHHMRSDPAYLHAVEQEKAYRKLLKKLTGHQRTPLELEMENAKYLTIYDLMKSKE